MLATSPLSCSKAFLLSQNCVGVPLLGLLELVLMPAALMPHTSLQTGRKRLRVAKHSDLQKGMSYYVVLSKKIK